MVWDACKFKSVLNVEDLGSLGSRYIGRFRTYVRKTLVSDYSAVALYDMKGKAYTGVKNVLR